MNTYVYKERIWKRITILYLFLLFSITTIFAQQGITVTGVISDQTGETLPGVSIQVKGTTTGTITDINGKYTLSVPGRDAVLVFSYIGFNNQELAVNGRSEINITLQESVESLEEVVVMGYTTRRRSEISGSVASVSSEKLNDVVSNDINSLLQGKIGGVVVERTSSNPNTQSNMTIRGNSSLSGNAAPLVVVDGIIGGSYSVNDVKSVTILKDAAATGLYGARAANGVMIIETNMGSSGKTQISFNSTIGKGFMTLGNLQLMNTRELWDFSREFMTPERFASARPESLLNTETDWMSLAYRVSTTQNYTLSATGGNDRTRFYVSGDYYSEEGLVRHNQNTIVNFRTNLDHKVNDKLSFAARINARIRNYENEASGMYGSSDAIRYMPWDSPYNPDGSIKIGLIEEGWTYRYEDNFLHGWQYNFDKGKDHSFDGNFTLTYKILPDLTFSSYNRGYVRNRKQIMYYDSRTNAGGGVGELRNVFYYNTTFVNSNRLNYDLRFNKHTLQFLAVHEYEANSEERNMQIGEGLPPGLSVMRAAATVRRTAPFRGGGADDNPGSAWDNKYLKVLAQVDYNFNSKYNLVASYIREGSSRFGSNVRYGNFFTVGGSWLVINEDFMKSQTIFDNLKVRLSYGRIGSSAIGNYDALGLYSFSSSFIGDAAAILSQLENPELTWEKIGTANLGFDISILKSRINATIDIYDKTSDGLLQNVPRPWTSGLNQRRENVGSLQNRGIEIALNTINVKTRSFEWETNFNISVNRNKILTLYNGEEMTSGSFRLKEGQDRYIYYNRKWVGVDPANGAPQWERVDPETGEVTIVNEHSQATQQFIYGKSANPKFTAGLANELTYKNFSLRFFFNCVYGNWINGSIASDGHETGYNIRRLQKGEVRWKNPGDIATEPKPIEGGNSGSYLSSSRTLQDGSYIRLRNVTFGYTLPREIVNKLNIVRARIYLSGDDLLTFTKYTQLNPESPVYNSTVSGEQTNNFTNSSYPLSRRFNLGLNITF